MQPRSSSSVVLGSVHFEEGEIPFPSGVSVPPLALLSPAAVLKEATVVDEIAQGFLTSLQELRIPARDLRPTEGLGERKVLHWKNSFWDRNLKRILFVPTACLGVTFGYLFSSAHRDLPEAPWWACLLRLGALTLVPHLIPSIGGLCLAEKKQKEQETSQVPIVLRWVTRGDKNSHLTRISVEMAQKIICEEGHQNFHLQIVVDEKFASKTVNSEGKEEKRRVKSHILLASEREQIPEGVETVVVPESFETVQLTRKKGRALVYAELRDKVIGISYFLKSEIEQAFQDRKEGEIVSFRRLQRVFEKTQRLSSELKKVSSSKETRKLLVLLRDLAVSFKKVRGCQREKSLLISLQRMLKNWTSPWEDLQKMIQEAQELERSVVSSRVSQSLKKKVRVFRQELEKVDPKADLEKIERNRRAVFGDFADQAYLVMDLERTLHTFLSLQDEEERTPCSKKLLQWTRNRAFQSPIFRFRRFTEPRSGVFHLDEESQLTKEVLTGINHFANEKKNFWRMGQGAIQYADTWNRGRKNYCWSLGDLQARFCQMLDSIRSADDMARFYFQFHGLKQVIFGAKGSFMYLPQVLEQMEGYDFDGGEITSITEDACMAFNVAPAAEELQKRLVHEMNGILEDIQSMDSGLKNLLRDPQFKSLFPPETLVEFFEKDINSLKKEVGQTFKFFGLDDFFEDFIGKVLEKEGIWTEKFRVSVLDSQSVDFEKIRGVFKEKAGDVKSIFQGISEDINHMTCVKRFGVVCRTDCDWITGVIKEQSPFTFWEFIVQRRRWFSGLTQLVKFHENIHETRRNMFAIALLGWSLMQFNTITLAAPLATNQYALPPVLGMIMGLVASTYTFLYFWGWLHQVHHSKGQRYGCLPLIPLAQLAAANIFESVPGILARVAPDLDFKLVEKNRKVDQYIFSKEELTKSSYQSLTRDELYLELVEALYQEYTQAFAKAHKGKEKKSSLSLEEFIDFLPKEPTYRREDPKLVLGDFERFYRGLSYVEGKEKGGVLYKIQQLATKLYESYPEERLGASAV